MEALRDVLSLHVIPAEIALELEAVPAPVEAEAEAEGEAGVEAEAEERPRSRDSGDAQWSLSKPAPAPPEFRGDRDEPTCALDVISPPTRLRPSSSSSSSESNATVCSTDSGFELEGRATAAAAAAAEGGAPAADLRPKPGVHRLDASFRAEPTLGDARERASAPACVGDAALQVDSGTGGEANSLFYSSESKLRLDPKLATLHAAVAQLHGSDSKFGIDSKTDTRVETNATYCSDSRPDQQRASVDSVYSALDTPPGKIDDYVLSSIFVANSEKIIDIQKIRERITVEKLHSEISPFFEGIDILRDEREPKEKTLAAFSLPSEVIESVVVPAEKESKDADITLPQDVSVEETIKLSEPELAPKKPGVFLALDKILLQYEESYTSLSGAEIFAEASEGKTSTSSPDKVPASSEEDQNKQDDNPPMKSGVACEEVLRSHGPMTLVSPSTQGLKPINFPYAAYYVNKQIISNSPTASNAPNAQMPPLCPTSPSVRGISAPCIPHHPPAADDDASLSRDVVSCHALSDLSIYEDVELSSLTSSSSKIESKLFFENTSENSEDLSALQLSTITISSFQEDLCKSDLTTQGEPDDNDVSDGVAVANRFVVKDGDSFKEPSSPFKFVLTVSLHGPRTVASSEVSEEKESVCSPSNESIEKYTEPYLEETPLVDLNQMEKYSTTELWSRPNNLSRTTMQRGGSVPVKRNRNGTMRVSSHSMERIHSSESQLYPEMGESDLDVFSKVLSVLNMKELDDIDSQSCLIGTYHPDVNVIESISNFCRELKEYVGSRSEINDSMSFEDSSYNIESNTINEIVQRDASTDPPSSFLISNVRDSFHDRKHLGTDLKMASSENISMRPKRKTVSLKLFSEWDTLNKILDQVEVNTCLKSFINHKRRQDDRSPYETPLSESEASKITSQDNFDRKMHEHTNSSQNDREKNDGCLYNTSSSISSTPLISTTDVSIEESGEDRFHSIDSWSRDIEFETSKTLEITETNDPKAMDDNTSLSRRSNSRVFAPISLKHLATLLSSSKFTMESLTKDDSSTSTNSMKDGDESKKTSDSCEEKKILSEDKHSTPRGKTLLSDEESLVDAHMQPEAFKICREDSSEQSVFCTPPKPSLNTLLDIPDMKPALLEGFAITFLIDAASLISKMLKENKRLHGQIVSSSSSSNETLRDGTFTPNRPPVSKSLELMGKRTEVETRTRSEVMETSTEEETNEMINSAFSQMRNISSSSDHTLTTGFEVNNSSLYDIMEISDMTHVIQNKTKLYNENCHSVDHNIYDTRPMTPPVEFHSCRNSPDIPDLEEMYMTYPTKYEGESNLEKYGVKSMVPSEEFHSCCNSPDLSREQILTINKEILVENESLDSTFFSEVNTNIYDKVIDTNEIDNKPLESEDHSRDSTRPSSGQEVFYPCQSSAEFTTEKQTISSYSTTREEMDSVATQTSLIAVQEIAIQKDSCKLPTNNSEEFECSESTDDTDYSKKSQEIQTVSSSEISETMPFTLPLSSEIKVKHFECGVHCKEVDSSRSLSRPVSPPHGVHCKEVDSSRSLSRPVSPPQDFHCSRSSLTSSSRQRITTHIETTLNEKDPAGKSITLQEEFDTDNSRFEFYVKTEINIKPNEFIPDSQTIRPLSPPDKFHPLMIAREKLAMYKSICNSEIKLLKFTAPETISEEVGFSDVQSRQETSPEELSAETSAGKEIADDQTKSNCSETNFNSRHSTNELPPKSENGSKHSQTSNTHVLSEKNSKSPIILPQEVHHTAVSQITADKSDVNVRIPATTAEPNSTVEKAELITVSRAVSASEIAAPSVREIATSTTAELVSQDDGTRTVEVGVGPSQSRQDVAAEERPASARSEAAASKASACAPASADKQTQASPPPTPSKSDAAHSPASAASSSLEPSASASPLARSARSSSSGSEWDTLTTSNETSGASGAEAGAGDLGPSTVRSLWEAARGPVAPSPLSRPARPRPRTHPPCARSAHALRTARSREELQLVFMATELRCTDSDASSQQGATKWWPATTDESAVLVQLEEQPAPPPAAPPAPPPPSPPPPPPPPPPPSPERGELSCASVAEAVAPPAPFANASATRRATPPPSAAASTDALSPADPPDPDPPTAPPLSPSAVLQPEHEPHRHTFRERWRGRLGADDALDSSDTSDLASSDAESWPVDEVEEMDEDEDEEELWRRWRSVDGWSEPLDDSDTALESESEWSAEAGAGRRLARPLLYARLHAGYARRLPKALFAGGAEEDEEEEDLALDASKGPAFANNVIAVICLTVALVVTNSILSAHNIIIFG